MKGWGSLLTISTFLMLLVTVHLAGCGGSGGDGETGSGDIPSDYLLFYGDNTNPDTSGDGLFKIQDGALWLLKTINLTEKSHVQGFTDLGDQTVFSACGLFGCEPWITDGTNSGTHLLKNINLVGDSNPTGYIFFDNEIYFSADDGRNGVELWKTDGTEDGTVMVKNIGIEKDIIPPPFPTPISSNPQELTVFNGALFFVANDIDFEGHGQGLNFGKRWHRSRNRPGQEYRHRRPGQPRRGSGHAS